MGRTKGGATNSNEKAAVTRGKRENATIKAKPRATRKAVTRGLRAASNRQKAEQQAATRMGRTKGKVANSEKGGGDERQRECDDEGEATSSKKGGDERATSSNYELAKAGQLDPVYGRDDEIRSALRTLVRPRKTIRV
jgi:ATP-dependent Clp protease ATP-binding subunit ClpA